MVDIEMGALGAFKKNLPTGLHAVGQHHRDIGHIRGQAFGVAAVLGENRLQIEGLGIHIVFQVKVLLLQDGGHLFPEHRLAQQFHETDTPTGGLVFVAGTDAPPGGADFLIALHPFPGMVDRLVVGHDEVGFLTDLEFVRAEVDPLG